MYVDKWCSKPEEWIIFGDEGAEKWIICSRTMVTTIDFINTLLKPQSDKE